MSARISEELETRFNYACLRMQWTRYARSRLKIPIALAPDLVGCQTSTTQMHGHCRIDQLLEQVDQGSQVVAVDPIQIAEDIAVPRRDSDLTAWVSQP